MAQHLQPGTLLHNGTYRIIDVLGRGGFGITYLALDLNLDRRVAVKEFFPKDYCERTDTTKVTVGTSSAVELVSRLKAKFLKEARNIAKFSHSGIIKIHAAFEENNTAYYIMDFINGVSLNELIRQNGPLSPERAISVITSVGESLSYVHQQKINHLDIKPGNIMWDNLNGCPILIDFGLSKQYDGEGNQTSTTPTGISVGYAPIEQYKNSGISTFSPQTDIYALGATLYFLITGTVPPDATDLAMEGLTFPAGIPASLKAAIQHAMNLRIADRPATVHDFLAEIIGEKKATKKEEVHAKSEVQTTSVSHAQKKNSGTLRHLPSSGETPRMGVKSILFLIAIVICIVASVIDFWEPLEHIDNYGDRPEALFVLIVLSLLLINITYIIFNNLFTDSKKSFYRYLLCFIYVLNYLLIKIHWLGWIQQNYIKAIYCAQMIFSFGILIDIILLLLLPDNTPKAIANQYAEAANKYIDAVNSGKSYEIDNAAAILNKFFDRQNRLLKNQKYKYEYMRYLDSQNIPFASSINQLLHNQRQ